MVLDIVMPNAHMISNIKMDKLTLLTSRTDLVSGAPAALNLISGKPTPSQLPSLSILATSIQAMSDAITVPNVVIMPPKKDMLVSATKMVAT